MLRINHEATGNWFSFNKRCSYQEVADFFVRASRIIKENAPNVQTIICIGGVEHPESGKIAIYYGCADSYVGLAFCQFDEIVDYIKSHSVVRGDDTEIGRR